MEIVIFTLIKTRLMEPRGTIDYKELYEQGQLEIARLRMEFDGLRQLNEQLLHRLDLLLKTHFGTKSERYIPKEGIAGQLSLELRREEPVLVSLEGKTEESLPSKTRKVKSITAKKKRINNM